MYEIPPWSPSLKISSPLSEDYAPLWYGYMDESGDLSPFSLQPLVLVAVLTQSPRELELVTRKISKRIRIKSRGGELKASSLDDVLVIQVLREIAELTVSINVVEVDKSVIIKPPRDTEVIYITAVSNLIQACLHKFPRLELHIDKRYSNPLRQIWFERWIRDQLLDISGISLTMVQNESTSCKPLQVADFVAFSAGRRVRGDDRLWKLIEKKVSYCGIIRLERWY
jgi:hypothetical protein